MTGALNFLSMALLLFGSNKLPPKPNYMKQGKCPQINRQHGFRTNEVTGITYFLNYASAPQNALRKFKCLTLRIEERFDDSFLHIYAKTKQSTASAEESWHRLRPETENGRFEIDLRLNHSDHEAYVYLYYDFKPTMDSFSIYSCIEFPSLHKHAVGALIASNKLKVKPKQVTRLQNQLKRVTKVDFNQFGTPVKNICEAQN